MFEKRLVRCDRQPSLDARPDKIGGLDRRLLVRQISMSSACLSTAQKRGSSAGRWTDKTTVRAMTRSLAQKR